MMNKTILIAISIVFPCYFVLYLFGFTTVFNFTLVILSIFFDEKVSDQTLINIWHIYQLCVGVLTLWCLYDKLLKPILNNEFESTTKKYLDKIDSFFNGEN